MKIIIIGCGKVGRTLTEQLATEAHNITVIDTNPKKIQEVTEDLDVLGITGNGASISTLQEAGVEQADILISVTGSDELNLLCCIIARKLGCKHTIARMRNPEYVEQLFFLREELGLSYQTVSTVDDPLKAPRELLPMLLDHQERHRQAELDARQCLTGPHKDDLAVELDGRSAKTYGSQGQTRTAALSLKLAQREIFFQETEEYPLLLLDDVLSELDAKRQSFVLNHIQGGQIFITCCEEEKLEGLEQGRSFHIQGGKLI